MKSAHSFRLLKIGAVDIFEHTCILYRFIGIVYWAYKKGGVPFVRFMRRTAIGIIVLEKG